MQWPTLLVGAVIGGIGTWALVENLHGSFQPEKQPAPPVVAAEAAPKRPAERASAPVEPAAPSAQQAMAPPSAPTPSTPAWLRYAVASPDPGTRPMIAIVIDDLGLNRTNARRVIDLPGPLTLSFMTYADEVAAQSRAAHAKGHELLVHVPMEPMGGDVDAGENVLRVDLPTDELRRRLRWDLSRFEGYVGINNHMGSRFTSWPDGMRLVLEEIKARGLLFLDSRTAPTTVAGTLAQAMGVPHADRDVFLDNDFGGDAVREKLAEVEKVARRHGYAVAIGHPHDTTIEALIEWLPHLSDRGFALVPLSAIVRRNAGPAG